MKSDYYVYLLFRETGRPLYVGRGRGRRWNVHEQTALTGDTHRDRAVRKVLKAIGSVPKVKLNENLTVEEANELERLWIRTIGREPAGPLINQTDGGDGLTNPSAEVRYRCGSGNRGRKLPEITCQRMSASRAGFTLSPEARARCAATNKARGHKRTAETRAKMSAAKLGKPAARIGFKLTEEHKAKLRGPRGPQPNMRGPRGSWFRGRRGNTYIDFAPRERGDKRGRGKIK